jgi:hypothetical protein
MFSLTRLFFCAVFVVCVKTTSAQSSITFENDVFAIGQKDCYLTNHVVISHSSFSVGQEMYTPIEKDSQSIPIGDRPWDGYTYLQYEQIVPDSNDDKRIFAYRLGAVGPASGAKHTQRFIHNDLGLGKDPAGWDTANPSEFTGEFIYKHQFNSTFKSWLGSETKLCQEYGFRFGNVRISSWLFQEVKKQKKWFYIYGNMGGEVKVYDTFLDGRLFRNNTYTVDKIPFVATLGSGIGFEYDNYFARFGYKYQTEEFSRQAQRHLFGGVTLGVLF